MKDNKFKHSHLATFKSEGKAVQVHIDNSVKHLEIEIFALCAQDEDHAGPPPSPDNHD